MRFFNRKNMVIPPFFNGNDIAYYKKQIDDYIESVKNTNAQRRPPSFWKVLKSSELKRSLWINFEKACAYCERRTNLDSGSITHHRPPGFAANERDRTEILNYIWLAYNWENWYWACDKCIKLKGNRFFVSRKIRNIEGKSVGELRDLEEEKFLDPCFHNVEKHIKFNPDGSVIPKSKEGEATIEIFKLNSVDLQYARRETNIKLAEILEKPGQAKEYPIEGSPNGMSDAIFLDTSTDTDSNYYDYFPHIGAACNSILTWAKGSFPFIRNCSDLINTLDDLQLEKRKSLLKQYKQKVNKKDLKKSHEKTDSKSKQKTLKQPSRLIDIFTTNTSEPVIDTVKIMNFKGIKDIELNFPSSVDDESLTPCTIILGENATGKSSILEAITLAMLGTDEIKQLDSSVKIEDIIPREFIYRPNPSKWEFPTEKKLEIKITYEGLNDIPFRVHGTSNYTELSARIGDYDFKGTSRPSKVLIAYGPRRFFSRKKMRRFRAPEHRVRSLFDPMAKIPNPVDWLLNCDTKSFDASIRALREVLLLDNEDDVSRDLDNRRVMINTSNGPTPLLNLSEGYKSIVSMSVDIIRELLTHYDNIENAHAVVVIDEIETHLHPRWKMMIVSRLRNAFPKVQFIITTHDPLCLRGMYKNEVIVLRRNENDGDIETLQDLPDIRGMRAEQILTSEFFGLGSTDPDTEAKLIRYQALSTDTELSDEGKAEMNRLSKEISDSMQIGDTFQEQIMNDAFRKANIDPIGPIGKIQNKSRKELIKNLVSVISNHQNKLKNNLEN